MVFNSNSDSQDLVSDVLFWCGIPSTDTTTFPIKAIARNANFALDRVVSLIMKNDRKWSWDDANNSDAPIGTTTLVDNQSDYALATTHLKIVKVRVLNSAGKYYSLESANREDLTNWELTQAKGLPEKYALVGNSVYIYPAPDSSQVTTALGLEITFRRGASYFASTDTTKVPGFASQFHRLISLYVARDYCGANDIQDRLTRIENEISNLERELERFYGERAEDNDKTISSNCINPR